MASRTTYQLTPHQFSVDAERRVHATAMPTTIGEVPLIHFSNGKPWLAANMYLANRARSKELTGGALETVRSESWHLLAYAKFLENSGLQWWSFPIEEEKRPTRIFRGHLIRARRAREISSSVASARIGAVKRFYSWVLKQDLLVDQSEPFTPKQVSISFLDRLGLRKSLSVESSDLAIPNRTAKSRGIEDGLFPLTTHDRDHLLKATEGEINQEFHLMLRVGFFTGMRIGTIVGLTQTAIFNVFPSREISGWLSIEVGPDAGIPTKGNVKYYPSIPPKLLGDLQDYCRSPRRSKRGISSGYDDSDLVFLKKHGGAYTNTTNRDEMARLKRIAKTVGLSLDDFRFHCTRATFGTTIASHYLRNTKLPSDQVIAKLMLMMGHSCIQSTLRYIQFIEQQEADLFLMENYAAQILGESIKI